MIIKYLKYLYKWLTIYGFTLKRPENYVVNLHGLELMGQINIYGPFQYYTAQKEKQKWIDVAKAIKARKTSQVFTPAPLDRRNGVDPAAAWQKRSEKVAHNQKYNTYPFNH